MAQRNLLLSANFPPLGGGISRYLYEIVRSLPSTQVQVIGLPTPGWEEFDKAQHFPIQRLNLPVRWDGTSRQFKFLAPFYLWRSARKRHIDYVLCGQAHHTLMLPAYLMQRFRGTPYGVFVFGLDVLRPQTRKYRRFFNHLLCSAEVVVADSQAAATIARSLGVKGERIHVINPPVDADRLKSNISPKVVRQRHGVTSNRCVLTVGRLVERKGHDTMIEALPLVLKVFPQTIYLIVGEGPQESRLRTLVKSLGLEDNVIFVGQVKDDELGAYYAVCDVFAMVSRDIPEKGDVEGFGIVFLEANLFGKPVVAGRSGGVPDAVLNEQTGLLVNPNDPQEVASAVVRLLHDAELAERLGTNGRSRVLDEFTGSAAADKLLRALAA